MAEWIRGRSVIERRLLLGLCVLAVLAVVGSLFISNLMKMRGQRAEMEKISEQILEVQNLNDDLLRQIDYTKTDAYIEQAARQQLGYIKPGEIRYVAK